jgi:hypothetical protein
VAYVHQSWLPLFGHGDQLPSIGLAAFDNAHNRTFPSRAFNLRRVTQKCRIMKARQMASPSEQSAAWGCLKVGASFTLIALALLAAVIFELGDCWTPPNTAERIRLMRWTFYPLLISAIATPMVSRIWWISPVSLVIAFSIIKYISEFTDVSHIWVGLVPWFGICAGLISVRTPSKS